jgi:hypothetical protein
MSVIQTTLAVYRNKLLAGNKNQTFEVISTITNSEKHVTNVSVQTEVLITRRRF